MSKNGGARPGAGRPKGVPSKKSQELIERAQASGIMPLELLLNDMRFFHGLGEAQMAKINDIDLANEETANIFKAAMGFKVTARECAEKVAPYLHPKLSSIDAKVSVSTHEAALAELE